MSPKPTVERVTIAQYMEIGMLLKPFSGPSTTYIMDPAKTHIITTANKKTRIFLLICHKALVIKLASDK